MNHQKKKVSRKKGKKKNRNVFKFKVFTPKSSQECVSFLFQDFGFQAAFSNCAKMLYYSWSIRPVHI